MWLFGFLLCIWYLNKCWCRFLVVVLYVKIKDWIKEVVNWIILDFSKTLEWNFNGPIDFKIWLLFIRFFKTKNKYNTQLIIQREERKNTQEFLYWFTLSKSYIQLSSHTNQYHTVTNFFTNSNPIQSMLRKENGLI